MNTTPEDIARTNAEILTLAKAMGRGDKVSIQPAEKKRWWQYGPDRPAYSSGWGMPGPHSGDRFPLPYE